MRNWVLALALVAAVYAKGIREVVDHSGERYDISTHGPSGRLTEAQVEDAEYHAETNARQEALAAGADKADQDAAAHEALLAVKFAATADGGSAQQSSLRFRAVVAEPVAQSAAASAAGSGEGSASAESSGSGSESGSGSGSGSGSEVAPKAGAAFGISYNWPVIDDAEIDKQAEIVAEWSVRARYRVEQERNASAAVIGTRKQVIDFASSAHSLTGDALDAKNEPGEEVLRHLEKSQDDTVLAKEARRRLKVLKDYLRSVSVKRKVATKKRDESIAELLRLKVLRINTAKQLWMTLKNKVVELLAQFEERLLIAAKDAEIAKQSEISRNPKDVVLAKLDASERAQAAARHVKVYMNAVEYKAKCAKALLAEWQCKVLINCTGVGAPEAPQEDERPLWSTPTLDALADTMNEAIAGYKDAKASVPRVPPQPKPAPPSHVEKRLTSLEKKYQMGEFAPSQLPGACKYEGGRIGHFVKGEGCQPLEEKKAVNSKAEVAADMAAAEEGTAGSSKAATPVLRGVDMGALEERIVQMEKHFN